MVIPWRDPRCVAAATLCDIAIVPNALAAATSAPNITICCLHLFRLPDTSLPRLRAIIWTWNGDRPVYEAASADAGVDCRVRLGMMVDRMMEIVWSDAASGRSPNVPWHIRYVTSASTTCFSSAPRTVEGDPI